MTGRLHPDDVEAIARRTAELLAERLSAVAGPKEGDPSRNGAGHRESVREQGERLMTADDVAAQIGLSADWVRAHADELGGRRIGTGPRGRWRFPASAVDAWSVRETSAEFDQVKKPAGPVRSAGPATGLPGTGLDFLPIRTLQPRPKKRAGRSGNSPGHGDEERASTHAEPTSGPTAPRSRAPRRRTTDRREQR